MDKKNLAFDKMNFILLAIGMAIVIIGFLLMSGAGSNEHSFDAVYFQYSPYCSGTNRYPDWFPLDHLCGYSQAKGRIKQDDKVKKRINS